MNLIPKLFAATLFALASLSASAAPIHSLNDQAPTGFMTGGITFSGNARGWEFTAGVDNVRVSQLGIAAATGGSYTLTLWDVASESVLAQTTLSNATAGSWNWVDLASSVALTEGASYLIMGIGTGANQDYFFSGGLPASWFPSGAINYQNTTYCNGCGANDFPINTLNGYQYGLVDIGYTIGAVDVPEPSSIAMFGLGLLAAGAIRRKKPV